MDGSEAKAMRSDKVQQVTMNDQNGYQEVDKKKKGKGSGSSGGGGSITRGCQAEKCNADLHDAKQYHRRHKVCEYHAKAQVVLVGGTRQRFCQQCSRFHELGEFDDTKEVAAGVWQDTMNGEERTLSLRLLQKDQAAKG